MLRNHQNLYTTITTHIKMQHTITLPNGRTPSVGAYAKAWRTLKRYSPIKLVGLFFHEPATVQTILAEMRKGLLDRINKHSPQQPGRNHDDDTFYAVHHVARRVNSRAVVRHSDFQTHPTLQRIAKRISARINA